MLIRKISAIIGITLILWLPLTALAGGETGFYLEAGVGRMDVNDTVSIMYTF